MSYFSKQWVHSTGDSTEEHKVIAPVVNTETYLLAYITINTNDSRIGLLSLTGASFFHNSYMSKF